MSIIKKIKEVSKGNDFMFVSKLDRSNKAHKRLSDKFNDLADNYSFKSSKHFWLLVKRNYHDSVILYQKEFGKNLI